MKKLRIALFTSAAVLSGICLYSQPKDASVMIDKANHHAVMITVDQPEKTTTQALQQRLERSGLKEKPKNGIAKYKGVTLSEISAEKVDIYTKVEAGPNNSSVVYMAVSRGYNNFTNSVGDSAINENVKTFLQSFIQDANNHSSDLDITSQANDIGKDEKEYKNLLDEQVGLEKKKIDIDNRLLEIKNELQVRKENIDKKKSGLQDSKTKRSSGN